MAKKENVVTIFVASPSDVAEERLLLESIVTEHNKVWCENLNLRLELLKWETHCTPGFGDYSQDVINQQIGDNYDVFLGLFWGRVGSPTPVAKSGTLEEFERAYKRFCEQPDSIDIMIYFKDAPISPSEMDFEQLQKISELKKELGEKGGLYNVFKDPASFEVLLKTHLAKIAQKWQKKLGTPQQEKPAIPAETSFIEEEELGLLEYLEAYEDSMGNLVSSLTSMTDATEKIGSQMSKRTEEINTLKSQGVDSLDSREVKKVIKQSGDDLMRYAHIMNSHIEVFRTSRIDAFDNLSKGVTVYLEMAAVSNPENNAKMDEEMANLMGSLLAYREASNHSESGLLLFRQSVVDLPRLTAHLNKAKRTVVSALDSTLEEIRMTVQSSDVVLQALREFEL
ncbi:TPA: hypothetical protein ACN359_000689 [Vibrio parahaemolyticus]|nr:hypothetical protein [Vibrio parahaemolyticus]HBB9972305.1 hypothetical protein [Vibrio parahaemolyticus]HBC0009174.1 hypothetical protein [Vibrio parahaemolyticus]